MKKIIFFFASFAGIIPVSAQSLTPEQQQEMDRRVWAVIEAQKSGGTGTPAPQTTAPSSSTTDTIEELRKENERLRRLQASIERGVALPPTKASASQNPASLPVATSTQLGGQPQEQLQLVAIPGGTNPPALPPGTQLEAVYYPFPLPSQVDGRPRPTLVKVLLPRGVDKGTREMVIAWHYNNLIALGKTREDYLRMPGRPR